MRDDDQSTMRALAKARPSALDPARLAGSHRQAADLAAILASVGDAPQPPREASRRRVAGSRPRGRVGRIALPVASVATAALLILAVGSQQANQPAVQNGQGSGTAVGGRQSGADMVLLPMASMAQYQTLTVAGEYWQEDTDTGQLEVASTGASTGTGAGSGAGSPGSGTATATQRYLISRTDHVITSLGVRPGEQSLVLTGEGAITGPASPRDLSIWQAAGSPKYVEVDGPDVAKYQGPPNDGSSTSASAQAPTDDANAPAGAHQLVTIGTGGPSTAMVNSGNSIVTIGDFNFDYADLQTLPADTDFLRTLLTKFYLQAHANGDPDATNQSQWMFGQAANLITMPVPPAVRAAAYRVLAALPGIEDLGPATDASGRSGLAMALALPAQSASALGSLRDELIVNPQSDSLLATEQVLIMPSAEARLAGLKSGTVVDYTTFISVGWSDHQIAAPTYSKE